MLERLLDLGKSVLAESDLDRVLTSAIDGAIELCGAERGMILLFDPQSGELVAEAARNLGGEETARTMLDKVRRRGEPRSNPSVICHPLRDGDRTIGRIYLDHRSAEGVFAEETARLVASFAELIAPAVRNALERRSLTQRIDHLSEQLRERSGFQGIVGHDPRMVEALRRVEQVADSEATVLLRGESGTGKELIARALHFNSRRRGRPFVPVHCGALPENLLEAELFGHVRGAFTGAVRDNPGWFERAEGGTLFLDEVGELTPALQVKILRVLENGEYSRVGSPEIRRTDARIVAATSRDLEALVREGKVRQDFLDRLNGVEVHLPPLRERRSDLPLLLRHFLDGEADRGRGPKRLSPEAEELLLAYPYPGNLRELQNILQRAVLLSEGPVLEVRHLPPAFLAPAAGGFPESGGLPLGDGFRAAKQRVIERFERDYIEQCLRAARGNISQAARTAGIDYKNFYGKMQQYRIDPAEFKG